MGTGSPEPERKGRGVKALQWPLLVRRPSCPQDSATVRALRRKLEAQRSKEPHWAPGHCVLESGLHPKAKGSPGDAQGFVGTTAVGTVPGEGGWTEAQSHQHTGVAELSPATTQK